MQGGLWGYEDPRQPKNIPKMYTLSAKSKAALPRYTTVGPIRPTYIGLQFTSFVCLAFQNNCMYACCRPV